MKASIKKIRVQTLRRQGMSLKRIAETLKIKKGGSLSRWCREIKLKPSQLKKIKEEGQKASLAGSERFAEKIRGLKEESKKRLFWEGASEIGRISKRELFICGVAMYWSEGYTYPGGEQVGFTNSDPQMILLMLRWFQEICGVSFGNITLHVKINETHKERSGQIENYWSNITDIPLSQFTKTTFIKTELRKIYPYPEDYYGTLRITTRKGSLLRRKIHGWIKGLAENNTPA